MRSCVLRVLLAGAALAPVAACTDSASVHYRICVSSHPQRDPCTTRSGGGTVILRRSAPGPGRPAVHTVVEALATGTWILDPPGEMPAASRDLPPRLALLASGTLLLPPPAPPGCWWVEAEGLRLALAGGRILSGALVLEERIRLLVGEGDDEAALSYGKDLTPAARAAGPP